MRSASLRCKPDWNKTVGRIVSVIRVQDALNPRRVIAVREYVSNIVGLGGEHVESVRRFDDGNRHHVYKVSYLDLAGTARDLVVRVSLGDDREERERAQREALVLKKLAGAGAPRLLDVQLSSPWFSTPVVTTEFVPGRSLELGAMPIAAIESLGSVVASVHAHPVDELGPFFDSSGTILSYAETRLEHILRGLLWARDPLPVPLGEGLRHSAARIQSSWNDWRDAESFRTDEQLALLHGDIAFGNVLCGPDPVLIDWEFARLGDPSDEIAYLFDQNTLSPSQRDVFWRGYGIHARRVAATAERVTWWEPLTLLGSTLWWAERYVRRIEADGGANADPAVPKEPGYYLERATSRLQRLEILVRHQ